jgi:hypothetical protein
MRQALGVLKPCSSDFSRLCDLLLLSFAGSARGPISGGMGAVAAAFLEKIRCAAMYVFGLLPS